VVHGAKRASDRDDFANKRARCAIGNGLLPAVGLGGGFAGGILVGLRGLGLGFGLRAGFANGVLVGVTVTDDALATCFWLRSGLQSGPRHVHAIVVDRNDVQILKIVVGGNHGGVAVDVNALDGGVHVLVVPTDDHVDLGR
jgi:hypothetical protein